MPQHHGAEPTLVFHQGGVAQPQLGREQDLAREVAAARQCPDEVPHRIEDLRLRAALPRREQHRRAVPAGRDVVRHRHGEMSGDEADLGVEADVLDGARHRLETQGRDALLDQPIGRRAHDGLAHAAPLPVGPYRERTHPALQPRPVRDVERRDLVGLVAPQHRPIARVEQGVAPHVGIELRHAHAHQAVAAVAISEGFREHAVQPVDVALAGALRSVDLPLRQPRPHRPLRGWRCRRALRSRRARRRTPPGSPGPALRAPAQCA